MITKTKIDQWCEAVIEAGWLAALVVSPLFFNVFSSRVFEPDKVSLIRTIALVMLLAWLIKIGNGGAPWASAYVPDDGVDRDINADGSGATTALTWRRVWQIPFLLPILLLVLAYSVSTLFSVAPFVSWWGSYQRLQGTYTFFSYVLISLLTMAHLRRPEQIRRLQHAVIITSLPIAIYGVIQHYRIDPLPWGGDVTRRIAANAGNAIFLAAYLIMAVFLTLERIYSSFAFLLGSNSDTTRRYDFPSALAGGAYLFVLLVQLLAIFWTQSRGPWLGLLLGIYIFVLLTLSALRPKRWRALLGGWVGLGVLGIALIVLMNTTPLFNSLKDVPYVGRLTQLLDQESNTAQVRLLIWTGASDMVEPHTALIYPDGSTDKVNPLRTLVGYGPEAMWVAYNPFYPPELAYVENRNASPDRSHNESWDALVITGVFGFVAYMALFISIFYWSLRWLGLLVNRRDTGLFAGLLGGLSLLLVVVFYLYDGSWRYFGVAVPAGLEAGLVVYIMLAPFLHPGYAPAQRDLPRLLLISAILATVAAHFVEIHFGIAIAATRTYFWVLTGLLLALGMRWATAAPFVLEAEAEPSMAGDASVAFKGKKRRRGQSEPAALPIQSPAGATLPAVARTIVIDCLIFVTLVFIYSTNGLAKERAWSIFWGSMATRVVNGVEVPNLALIFLLLFTWVVATTLGLAVTALHSRAKAGAAWWARGFLLHALVVWGLWLGIGLFHARRVLPGIAGNDLDSQLNQVANHFALYTWLVVLWLLASGTFFAWPWLRANALPAGRRTLVGLGVGLVAGLFILFVVANTNIGLVRADVIYKQGQQFDSQGNWLSSVELYRRALAARTTEDHYMLFLGRALLEQAKQSPADGLTLLPADPKLDDVLALTPGEVNSMARQDVLRAAEVVLREAQRVNPLNTDHTANLARLYRTWADLMPGDPAVQQTMLDKSIEQYNLAVQLSPNAAHLWNEKGNAHLARRERDQAETAYRQSLEIDPLYEQTYLLLADLLDGEERYADEIVLLEEGIATRLAHPRSGRSAAMLSYLSVAQARTGDLPGAIASNLAVLEIEPNNVGAMRNLALLYRDAQEYTESIAWTERSIENTPAEKVNELIQLRQVLVENYAQLGQEDQVMAQYELIQSLDPSNVNALTNLSNFYLNREDWNKAAETLQTLLALDPDNYRHPLAFAQVLLAVGQVDNARTLAEQALDLAPLDQQSAVLDFLAGLTAGD